MTAAFDPWALAEAWEVCKARPDDGAARQAWAALYEAAEAASAPREQLDAAATCLGLRGAIEAGDGGAVLDAVAYCAAAGLALPQWLVDAYLQRHGAVGRGEARDWGDENAFGQAYPKGTNIAGVRAFVLHAGPAYQTAAQLLAADPERPVDRVLYEDVGELLGIGQARVQELIGTFLGDGYRPPLAHLRARLRAGRTAEQAYADWQSGQHDKWLRDSGHEPDADGVWSRPINPGK